MPFQTKSDHPLGWGEKELRYLISINLREDGTIGNISSIYRAMGYTGKIPTPSFKRRLERIRKGIT